MQGTSQEAFVRVKVAKVKRYPRLNLFRCEFNQVPEEVFELLHLQYLNLGENNIKEIPAEISKLKNLTHLFLDNNLLVRLPKEIWGLKEFIILSNFLISLIAGCITFYIFLRKNN